MIVQNSMAMCPGEELAVKIKQISYLLEKTNQLLNALEKINLQVKDVVLT